RGRQLPPRGGADPGGRDRRRQGGPRLARRDAMDGVGPPEGRRQGPGGPELGPVAGAGGGASVQPSTSSDPVALLMELRRRAPGGHGVPLYRPALLGAEARALPDGGSGRPGGGRARRAALARVEVDLPRARRAAAGGADVVPRREAAAAADRRQ